ncbi:MAG: threonylcarbamoyl-AMP synthase [Clostridia bacterium]|nr:threonylcarbamoyl-AMP synthase [Clostridia bacterium]
MESKCTKVLKITENNTAEIKYAADVLSRGGLVVFPTETVYGLGADALNEAAVRNIYEAKGRPSDNPLIIHISSPEEAEKYAYTHSIYYKLAERFMPGPLTVVMKARSVVPSVTRGGLDTVAVRCPKNALARALIAAFGRPVAAPSANISGTPSPTSPSHVIKDMTGRVDVIIDGGECDFGLESTIVSINDDGSLILLRPGRITVDDLLLVVDEVRIADAVTDKLPEGAVALSPGMKYKHYAPKADLVLLDASDEEFVEFVRQNTEGRVGIIAYTELIPELDGCGRVFDFGSRDEEEEHARRLFSILRLTDEESLDKIYAPLPRTEGIGLALYNRMIRASAHKIIRMRR